MPRTLTIGGSNVLEPGALVIHARENATPLDAWQRANSYTCPRGPEPGVAWLVMLRSDLDALGKNSFHQLIWDDGTTKLTIPSLAIVRSYSLNIAKAGATDAARLVEFVDKRRQLKLSSTNTQYNVRIPAPSATSGATLYYTDSRDGGLSRWSWQTMLDDIWGDLPSTAGTAPTLPYSPNDRPEGFRFIGVSSWEALHVVLGKIDCTTVYNPITDTFSYVRLGTTQSGLAGSVTDLSNRLRYDYDPGDDYQLANMPATVRVFFPRREQLHGIEKDTPDSSNWEMSPTVSKDHTTSITGALSGTVMAVWDDLPALVNSSGSNINSTNLQTRADEIGGNIVNTINVSDERMRRTYSGITTDILPGSEVAEVHWRNFGDETGLVTEILNKPDGEGIGPGIARDPAYVGEHLATYDLSRNSHPVYPRVSQLVQVDDGASTTGATLTANGDGLFPGFVRRWAAGALSTLDACWIRAVDLETTASPSEANVIDLRQKDTLIGRLSGIETSGGTTLPAYMCRGGSSENSSVLWGKATANWKDNGSSCDHVVINPVDNCAGDNATGATITVLLPKSAEQDPNVISGEVIAYKGADRSKFVCVSDYLDEKIGTVKLWALASGGIPPGWAVMDGSANTGGTVITASGINMNSGASDGGGRFVRGSSTAGETGGALEHTHVLNVGAAAVAFANAIVSVMDVAPHTQSDLDHGHTLSINTEVGEDTASGTTFATITPDCTIGFPHAGHSEGARSDVSESPDRRLTDCPSGFWGPLHHTLEVNQSGGDSGASSVVFGAILPAQHLPEYTSLIFIERIDNSA